MTEMLAYIGLGANLGDPVKALEKCFSEIAAMPGVSHARLSSLWKTAPVDSSGPDYINAVVEVRTTLEAEALLTRLLAIESEFGRVRPAGVVNAPRVLDCDLLLYGQEVINTPFLTVPHPRMHKRAFVLAPLLELSPAVEIPGLGAASQHLPLCADQAVERLDSRKYK